MNRVDWAAQRQSNLYLCAIIIIKASYTFDENHFEAFNESYFYHENQIKNIGKFIDPISKKVTIF